MPSQIILDKEASTLTATEIPGYPWIRFDADRFLWEEVFFEGNLLGVHSSAMGRCQSRENIHPKLARRKGFCQHLYAFELEVDGQLLRDRWTWRGEQVGKTPEGFDKCTVELGHEDQPISVNVHTLLDGTSFLVRWLEITNEGSQACALSGVSPWAGVVCFDDEGNSIPPRDDSAGRFRIGRYRYQDWAMEGAFYWSDLPEDTLTIRNGRSSPGTGGFVNPPLFIVQDAWNGTMTAIHVECSMSFQVEFSRGHEPHRARFSMPWLGEYIHAKVGLGGKVPHRVLEPGETAITPAVHVSQTYGDLDDCIVRLHDHLRKSVIPAQPADRQHLVECNHTGYTGNIQISKEHLLREVDMAAAIGVELFLVDAGWFGPKDKGWWLAIGDWRENPMLGTGGLKEVFQHARRRGMKCGLWRPPEVASKDTPIMAEHPDWFLPGGFFNLLDPKIEKFVYDSICGAVEEFALDCYRIDCGNVHFGDRKIGGMTEDIAWRYFDKFYGIIDRVRSRFPHLLMENCCGGGGRTDLGMMRRFHYTQITDNVDPACQVRILNGMTMGLPPEQCMPLVGSISMRSADIDFVVRTGMFGHFTVSGIFPSLGKVNTPSLERWKHGVDLYKKEIRPMLSTCRAFHHTPVQDYQMNGQWVVLEYAGLDATAAVVGVFRLQNSPSDSYVLVPRGLDPSRDYSVRFDNSGRNVVISGRELCSMGLPVRVPGSLMSELLIIKPA